jgi:hypothetical protein
MSNGAVKRGRASVRGAGSRGIAWISAGNSSQHCRGVYRAAGRRPDMVHGWGKGEDPDRLTHPQIGFTALICSMAAHRAGVQLLPRHQKLNRGVVSPKSSPATKPFHPLYQQFTQFSAEVITLGSP